MARHPLMILVALLMLAPAAHAQERIPLDRLHDREVVEGSPVEFVLTLGEEDPDGVTLRANDLPVGATFDPDAGRFHWIPSMEQTGVHAVSFAAVAAGTSLEDVAAEIRGKSVAFTVVERPYPPAFAGVPAARTLREGQRFDLLLEARDKNAGDKLTFSADALPGSATLDVDRGLFSWTPVQADVGVVPVRFNVTDPSGLTDTRQVVFTVEDVEHDPIIDAGQTVRYAVRGQELSFEVVATDPDDQLLTITLGEHPFGAVLEEREAIPGRAVSVLRWTPAETQLVRDERIEFLARDEKNSTAAATITVRNSPIPVAPELYYAVSTPAAIQREGTFTIRAGEGSEIRIELRASDKNGGRILFRQSGCPCEQGMHIDSRTGVFLWQPGYDVVPDNERARSIPVVFEAVDETNLVSDPVTFNLEIENRVDTESRRALFDLKLSELQQRERDLTTHLKSQADALASRRSGRKARTVLRLAMGAGASFVAGTIAIQNARNNPPSDGMLYLQLGIASTAALFEGLELSGVFPGPEEIQKRVTVLDEQLWSISDEKSRLLNKYTPNPATGSLVRDDFINDVNRVNELIKRADSKVQAVAPLASGSGQ